jgi:hypothetical protein
MTEKIKEITLQKGDFIHTGAGSDAEPYFVNKKLIAEIVKEIPGASMIVIRSLKNEVFNESDFPISDRVFYVHKPA